MFASVVAGTISQHLAGFDVVHNGEVGSGDGVVVVDGHNTHFGTNGGVVFEGDVRLGVVDLAINETFVGEGVEHAVFTGNVVLLAVGVDVVEFTSGGFTAYDDAAAEVKFVMVEGAVARCQAQGLRQGIDEFAVTFKGDAHFGSVGVKLRDIFFEVEAAIVALRQAWHSDVL